MTWSKYNILYNSSKYGFFLYNARTNGFIRLDETTYEYLTTLQELRYGISLQGIDTEMSEILLRMKVLVDDFEDDNFVIQKKFLKYHENFDTTSLGVIIVPTLSCNFACPYCYEHNQPDTIMNDDTIRDTIRFIKGFKKADDLNLCWHGGEPLVAKNAIFKLLHELQKSDLRTTTHSLVTNGYLLDYDTCVKLRDYNLTFLQITIDGMPETHNKTRIHKSGHSTFEKIVSNIETFFDINPECLVLIRVNVHEGNKDEFPLLCNYLTARWGKNKKYIIALQYVDDRGGCKVKCLKHRERIKYVTELHKNCEIDLSQFYPSFRLGGCSADHVNTFIIGTDGELYKCWVEVGQKDKVIGHINEPTLNLSRLSEFIVGSDMFNDEKCVSCQLLPICDGGCELYRINSKVDGSPYDICPYAVEDIPLLLDTFYELRYPNDMIDNES